MLKGIDPCLSPDLLKLLAEMGHGDELVLADAHFPGHSLNARVLRAEDEFHLDDHNKEVAGSPVRQTGVALVMLWLKTTVLSPWVRRCRP
jgi:hypothetical protein